MSRRELSRRAGLSPSYISLILSGKRMPSMPTAMGIAHHLGLSLDQFYLHLQRLRRKVRRAAGGNGNDSGGRQGGKVVG